MTLQEVADVASILIGKQVDTALCTIYLKEGIRLLTAGYPTACPLKCTAIHCEDPKQQYPLPKNRGVYKIYREGLRYFDYAVQETGLKLAHRGNYQVYYYQFSSGEFSENEPIPIAAEYDAELCKYVAFSVLRADDPSSRLASQLIEEFHDNCTAIHQSISKRLKQQPSPLRAPHWQ